MSLSLILDAPTRLMLEPGYRRAFSAAELAGTAMADGTLSRRGLWVPPGGEVVMLKPLQVQTDFLNYSDQQIALSCTTRLTDFLTNPTDLLGGAIFELIVGSPNNIMIGHAPSTTSAVLPPPTKLIQGFSLPYTLSDISRQVEIGVNTHWEDTNALPDPPANALKALATMIFPQPQNQGWLFRWYQPPPQIGLHQTVYAFAFAQYCAVCRGALLEVFEDISPSGDRTQWQLRWKGSLFTPGASVATPNNPTEQLGIFANPEIGGGYQSLLILPYRKQRVLFASPTQHLVANVRAHPRRTADGTEWDILRAASVDVWALTPAWGIFQVQKLRYNLAPAVLDLPEVLMEYTPQFTPAVLSNVDTDDGSSIIPSIHFPKNYTFPTSPLSDDCPAPTNLSSGQQRAYGVQAAFLSSADGKRSPELYNVEIISDPVFMDNPSPATAVGDVSGASRVLHVETSLGSQPGEGRMTARVLDVPGFPLAKYQFRSEMPVQLQADGVPVFTGYTDRIEAQPWRGDPTAPEELRLRCTDRWLLLESTFLREQRDWKGVGHITVVDSIARQCGIDTGDPPGANAEYPAGWNTNMASVYDTPLGTPILTTDNEEGNQLLGWKPQPHDTGATFLKRITDFYSNWLVGFRPDGTFYYLPYTYFTASSTMFHTHQGRHVDSGLTPDLSLSNNLTLFVHGGTATVNGPVTATDQTVSLTDNSTNTLYVSSSGMVSANTTGTAPPGSVTLGTATTAGGQITSADISAASGRQTAASPVYRHPLEYRTIEPSGNFVQVQTHYALDQTANRSGVFIDWASLRNPKVVNYLGRPKWFKVEIGGAHDCAALNLMAYIVFKNARRRRLRVSVAADYVPTLKIGQIATLEGLGLWRLLELRATFTRTKWEIANYVFEKVERGYGLPS